MMTKPPSSLKRNYFLKKRDLFLSLSCPLSFFLITQKLLKCNSNYLPEPTGYDIVRLFPDEDRRRMPNRNDLFQQNDAGAPPYLDSMLGHYWMGLLIYAD